MRWIAALAGITTVQSDARTASYRLPDVSGRGSFENAFAPRSRRHIVTLARTYLAKNNVVTLFCVLAKKMLGALIPAPSAKL